MPDIAEQTDWDLTKGINAFTDPNVTIGTPRSNPSDDEYPVLKSVNDLIGDVGTVKLNVNIPKWGKKIAFVIKWLNMSEFASARRESRSQDEYSEKIVERGVVQPALSRVDIAVMPVNLVATLAKAIMEYSGECVTEAEDSKLKKS